MGTHSSVLRAVTWQVDIRSSSLPNGPYNHGAISLDCTDALEQQYGVNL